MGNGFMFSVFFIIPTFNHNHCLRSFYAVAVPSVAIAVQVQTSFAVVSEADTVSPLALVPKSLVQE
jgi:hypothetical protein